MRTALPLSVAAATLMALSCSSGGPTVCEGSDAIPQQTVKVDEDLRVAAVCFEDPGGGDLTYSGVSADESIAEAFGRGGAVFVRGVSPGQTSVTATATNESDLSESVEFQVLVTNQAPEFTDSVTADEVGVGRFGRWRLHSLFVEPDGDSMTFAATSNFPGLAVALTDSFVNFTGASAGQAQVTLTATDPHGEAGSGTISVDVWAPEVVFVDEFDSDASLDDWNELDDETELTIVNGALVVKSLADGRYGIAERSGEDVAEFYLDITTRIEAGGQTGTIWFVNNDEAYRLLFGNFADDNNWLFHRWGGADDGWLEVGEGNSSLIALDRYRTYSIIMYDMGMQILVDGQVAENVIFSDFEASTIMAGLWLIGTEDGTEYDRVQLSGRPGSTSHHDIADGDAKRELPHELMLTLPPLSGHQ
ncbi:MAG: hypothetical protein J4F34_06045 [Gemmatimonadetes bacterium]|nr:hypothetical protein [Gemmatimonadota bacterium]